MCSLAIRVENLGTRPVFEDVRGQYVLDDNGEPVYGVWFIPTEKCDRPYIVELES